MKYMVMECHFSYAVVLDEEGKFWNVANLHYETGQIVAEVVKMEIPLEKEETVPRKSNRWIYGLAVAAACLVLAMTSLLQINQMPYASVYLTINPEVLIGVNRKDEVVRLEGCNEDGKRLIDGFAYQKEEISRVMDQLIDRAIEMGYLHEGGQISLTLDANEEWIIRHKDPITEHLIEYVSQKMSVTIEVIQKNAQKQEAIIPVRPDKDTESSFEEDSGDSGYEEETEDSGDSGYEEETEDSGDSGYEEETEDSGDSGYKEETEDFGDSGYERLRL